MRGLNTHVRIGTTCISPVGGSPAPQFQQELYAASDLDPMFNEGVFINLDLLQNELLEIERQREEQRLQEEEEPAQPAQQDDCHEGPAENYDNEEDDEQPAQQYGGRKRTTEAPASSDGNGSDDGSDDEQPGQQDGGRERTPEAPTANNNGDEDNERPESWIQASIRITERVAELHLKFMELMLLLLFWMAVAWAIGTISLYYLGIITEQVYGFIMYTVYCLAGEVVCFYNNISYYLWDLYKSLLGYFRDLYHNTITVPAREFYINNT